jgi:hypothetical protein
MFQRRERHSNLAIETSAAAPALAFGVLPERHQVHFISDVVEQPDLSKINSSYQGNGQGQPPCNLGMMRALLSALNCLGVPSSLQIVRKTHEDVAFRVIAANRRPDHGLI